MSEKNVLGVELNMDLKDKGKEDGESTLGSLVRKENGHIEGVQTNRNESVFPVKKPGFYKNPNKNSTGILESNPNSQNGNAESSKQTRQHKENKTDKWGANGSEETVSSSGIDCGASEKTDSNFDSTSVGSGSNTHHRHEGQDRVINLCTRGDWIVLDQHLRNIRRAHPSLMKADPVSGYYLIFITTLSEIIFFFTSVVQTE